MRHNQNSPKVPPEWSLPKDAIEIEPVSYDFGVYRLTPVQENGGAT